MPLQREDDNMKYDITIEHCNNIKMCNLCIDENKLNIKYAINGTGKSTISKAIKLTADGTKLDSLMPFPFIAKKEKTLNPTVSNMPFSNVAVFNDEYLKQYVYQKTDLLKNTFEVMINSDKYTELKEKIDRELTDVKQIARDKPNISKIREITTSLCKLLTVNKDNTTLSRKQGGVKSLLDEKKSALFNPPDELSEFKPFIDDEKSIEWASWKLKGIALFGEKGVCPYCAETETEHKRKKTEVFKNSFDEVSITYANQIREYLSGISEYINEDKMKNLLNSLNSSADRSVLEMQLVKLRSEADYLSKRLYVLANFDGYSIDQNNMNEFEAKFADMIINESVLDYFNTELFFSEIRPLNEQIRKVIDMIGKLKGEVAIFQSYLKNQIKTRKDDINEFLASAGFHYSFDIVVDGDNSAHAVLKYQLEDGAFLDVSNPDNHLSWGEKNAFALLLFMFDAISKKADLIILDDPISSFDSNKKYAIINRLFKTGDKDNSLYQRTVMMLTHDFEPVIDYVQVGGKLSGDSISAHYLQNNEGTVSELTIQKNIDMMSMVVLMKELAMDNTISMPVRIGCLRKYIEHTNKDPKLSSPTYNLLSSLIHGRTTPTNDSDGEINMSDSDINIGLQEIQKYISDFDYSNILAQFESKSLIGLFETETNNFFKLLIIRTYIERDENARNRLKAFNDSLRKYTDETYHIENDYLYSLDVRKFNIVPPYYIDALNAFVASEKKCKK